MLNAVNLSHEALDPSAPVPSCKGRGWLSDELSQNQWTVSLMAAGQAEVAMPSPSPEPLAVAVLMMDTTAS